MGQGSPEPAPPILVPSGGGRFYGIAKSCLAGLSRSCGIACDRSRPERLWLISFQGALQASRGRSWGAKVAPVFPLTSIARMLPTQARTAHPSNSGVGTSCGRRAAGGGRALHPRRRLAPRRTVRRRPQRRRLRTRPRPYRRRPGGHRHRPGTAGHRAAHERRIDEAAEHLMEAVGYARSLGFPDTAAW
jgi:hypothetical protein